MRKDDKADLSLRSVYNYGNYGFTAIFNTSDKVNVTATIDKVSHTVHKSLTCIHPPCHHMMCQPHVSAVALQPRTGTRDWPCAWWWALLNLAGIWHTRKTVGPCCCRHGARSLLLSPELVCCVSPLAKAHVPSSMRAARGSGVVGSLPYFHRRVLVFVWYP